MYHSGHPHLLKHLLLQENRPVNQLFPICLRNRSCQKHAHTKNTGQNFQPAFLRAAAIRFSLCGLITSASNISSKQQQKSALFCLDAKQAAQQSSGRCSTGQTGTQPKANCKQIDKERQQQNSHCFYA